MWNNADSIIGLAVIVGLIVGVASFLVAVMAFTGGDWTGTGVCLCAAALAFGLTANAVLRR
jgi:hypothetical protein